MQILGLWYSVTCGENRPCPPPPLGTDFPLVQKAQGLPDAWYLVVASEDEWIGDTVGAVTQRGEVYALRKSSVARSVQSLWFCHVLVLIKFGTFVEGW